MEARYEQWGKMKLNLGITYWVFRVRPSFGILKIIKEHSVSESWSISETLFLRWTKSKNTVIPSAIHHRQNPLESTWIWIISRGHRQDPSLLQGIRLFILQQQITWYYEPKHNTTHTKPLERYIKKTHYTDAENDEHVKALHYADQRATRWFWKTLRSLATTYKSTTTQFKALLFCIISTTTDSG
jgi:hypothetical protein